MTREELLKVAKPILFNTEMVKAILDGRKTVTRRLVKTKSKDACGFYVTTRKADGAFMGVYDYDENERMFDNPQTQPAYVGDILYVRETWAINPRPNMYGNYYYRANRRAVAPEGTKWHPSIHMPKEAARIFLKVTDVRVERLQEITEDASGPNNQVVREGFTYECDFIAVWNSTIKKSDLELYGWDANPYVWVVEFERIEVE